jgi:hypothetical protein
MNGDVTGKSSSTFLAAGGAGFLALAGYFLWRDLALPPQIVLSAAAAIAAIAAALGRPRRWPGLAPGALLALALVGGAWFAAVKAPALLPPLAVTALGSIAAVVVRERRGAPGPAGALESRLAWYAAGTSFLVASGAFYFQFLTLGIADESVARRLIPTITWLAVGLALLIAARSRSSPTAQVGIGLAGVAIAKALLYDSTHLQGPLRVTLFAAVGGLLLAGARLVGERRQ